MNLKLWYFKETRNVKFITTNEFPTLNVVTDDFPLYIELVDVSKHVFLPSSLCFSLDSEYMLCSSDKATVHIFSIKDQTLNKKLRYVCTYVHYNDIISTYIHAVYQQWVS